MKVECLNCSIMNAAYVTVHVNILELRLCNIASGVQGWIQGVQWVDPGVQWVDPVSTIGGSKGSLPTIWL